MALEAIPRQLRGVDLDSLHFVWLRRTWWGLPAVTLLVVDQHGASGSITLRWWKDYTEIIRLLNVKVEEQALPVDDQTRRRLRRA